MKRRHDPYDLPGSGGGRFSNYKVPHWRYHNPDILQYLHLMQDDDDAPWPETGWDEPRQNVG